MFVNVPSSIGRLTLIGTVTVWPGNNWPPLCVQVTVAPEIVQPKVAVPAETVAVTGSIVVPPVT